MKSNPVQEAAPESMVQRFCELEAEIQLLKERNARVEADKAWETSASRKSFLLVATYLITSTVFWLIGVSNPFSNALIPSIGYYLSTLTLPILKGRWLRRNSSSV